VCSGPTEMRKEGAAVADVTMPCTANASEAGNLFRAPSKKHTPKARLRRCHPLETSPPIPEPFFPRPWYRGRGADPPVDSRTTAVQPEPRTRTGWRCHASRRWPKRGRCRLLSHFLSGRSTLLTLPARGPGETSQTQVEGRSSRARRAGVLVTTPVPGDRRDAPVQAISAP